MRGRALLGTLVLGAALLVPVGTAQAWTPGSNVCHAFNSERSLLTTSDRGGFSNTGRARCISGEDHYYVPKDCTARVNGVRVGSGKKRTIPYATLVVRIDC